MNICQFQKGLIMLIQFQYITDVEGDLAYLKKTNKKQYNC